MSDKKLEKITAKLEGAYKDLKAERDKLSREHKEFCLHLGSLLSEADFPFKDLEFVKAFLLFVKTVPEEKKAFEDKIRAFSETVKDQLQLTKKEKTLQKAALTDLSFYDKKLKDLKKLISSSR